VNGNPTPRDYNKAAVLDVVLSRAPVTRTEVMELTGLSKATVSRAVEELRVEGFVVDGSVDEVRGRGRRSTYLDVPDTTGHVTGISFGVRTTCVLVADLRGREIDHVVLPTQAHEEVTRAARWIADLVTATGASAAGPLRQVVVAVPGRVMAGTELVGPAEAMRGFAGTDLQRSLADLLEAPVLLESDANASLLGILTRDASVRNAVLFTMSSILNFASCTDHAILRGRTAAFGDVGLLVAGVGGETLAGLLSTSGLLRFARAQGVDLARVEDLWEAPDESASRAKVIDSFTTALVTAVSAVAVTLDPDSVYFVGRLQPLVDEVMPEVRRRLLQALSSVPHTATAPQVLGLSVAQGAVDAGLGLVRKVLRDAVLDARRPSQRTPAPAF
jgi:predicted NBD/HSP70 family sugar kinase